MAKYRNTEISACPVAEGVRFQLGNATAFAVRNQKKDISVRVRRERHPMRKFWEQVPFVRGIIRLYIALFGFLDSLSESSEMKPQDITRGTWLEQRFSYLFRLHSSNLVAFASAVSILAVVLGLVVGLPWVLEEYVLSLFRITRTALNAFVTVTRIIGLMAALCIIARLRIVRRFCMYQGAINKVLNAYEYEGKKLTFKDTMAQSPYHPRSDSVFVMLVVIFSIIAFAFLHTYTLHIQILVRILTILAIAGIVNEPLALLEDSDPDNLFVHALLTPIYRLQRIFVFEPHTQMVEVALCAFNAVRENDVW